MPYERKSSAPVGGEARNMGDFTAAPAGDISFKASLAGAL